MNAPLNAPLNAALPIGQLLLEARLIGADQLRVALHEQQRRKRPRLNGGLLPRVALSLRAQMNGIMRRRCLPCFHEVGRMGGRREHGRCGTEEKAFHAEISWLSARCCGRSKTSS